MRRLASASLARRSRKACISRLDRSCFFKLLLLSHCDARDSPAQSGMAGLTGLPEGLPAPARTIVATASNSVTISLYASFHLSFIRQTAGATIQCAPATGAWSIRLQIEEAEPEPVMVYKEVEMSKLFYFAIFATLVAVLACSGATAGSTGGHGHPCAGGDSHCPTRRRRRSRRQPRSRRKFRNPAPPRSPARPRRRPRKPRCWPRVPAQSGRSGWRRWRLSPPNYRIRSWPAWLGPTAMKDWRGCWRRPAWEPRKNSPRLSGVSRRRTVLRIFITGLLGDTGPLSEESSVCIRAGMEPIGPRSVMLAGLGGDPQAAMSGQYVRLHAEPLLPQRRRVAGCFPRPWYQPRRPREPAMCSEGSWADLKVMGVPAWFPGRKLP